MDHRDYVVSYLFPVTFDHETLVQYREELQWAHQEVEMLAINLERTPDDMATVEQIRNTFQDLWMSSVKLDLIPISESLEDTLKGLDFLLDWQVYPARMTEFVLILIDRVLVLAHEVEETLFIDMRKTQAILVALQYIILAKSIDEITEGIENAIVAISQEINDTASETDGNDDVVLFDDGVDLFGDEPETSAASVEQGIDIFVPQAILNPLNQAREYIGSFSTQNCLMLLGDIADHATPHHSSHTKFLLELSLAMNFLAGEPLNMEYLFKGICLHDIALGSLSHLLVKKDPLTKAEIDELKLHPVKGANVVHELLGSDDIGLLVLHHHEHLDGSGYPYGLIGNNISEQGKLAGIVDAFHGVIEQNAGMTDRERVLKAIVAINVNMGRHYDKSWVTVFNTCLRDYWLPDWRAARRA